MNRIKSKKIVLFALSVFLLFSCNSGEDEQIIRTQNPSPEIPPIGSTPNTHHPDSAPNISPMNPLTNVSPPASPGNSSPANPAPNISPPEESSFSAELLPPPLPLTEEQKEELGIVGIIQSNTAGSHFCTESYVPQNTIAELTIRWSVNAQGKMSPISILENPTNNKELAKCFTAFLSQLEYPKSLEGDTITLIQTFVFSWK